METPPWYVITGTTHSGKDTIVNELALRGFQIVPEVARVIMNRAISKGISPEEYRTDETAFQKEVFQEKLAVEEILPRYHSVFLNRGVPDSIAYYRLYGMDTKEVEDVSKNRYRKMFFLEKVELPAGIQPVGLGYADYGRKEEEEKRVELDRYLRECYHGLDYDVVYIPKMPVEERVELILSKL